MLRICGISVTGLLAVASVTEASLSIPIASFVLAGISIASITFTELMIDGFTGKCKKYFRRKCDYIKGYVNKLEIFLLKIKEDGQVIPTEFKLFQGLLKEYENGMMISKLEIKSKDFKKVEKMAKKELRHRRLNQLYERRFKRSNTKHIFLSCYSFLKS